MARYLIEAMMSPQSCLAMIQKPQDRAAVLNTMFDRLDIKIEAYYYSVGNGKHFVVLEAREPLDPVMLEAFWLAQYGAGTVNSVTILPVLTSAEAVEAFKKVGEINYRPPS